MVNRPVVVGGQNHSLHVSVPVSNTIYWSFRKGKNQLTTFLATNKIPVTGWSFIGIIRMLKVFTGIYVTLDDLSW